MREDYIKSKFSTHIKHRQTVIPRFSAQYSVRDRPTRRDGTWMQIKLHLARLSVFVWSDKRGKQTIRGTVSSNGA